MGRGGMGKGKSGKEDWRGQRDSSDSEDSDADEASSAADSGNEDHAFYGEEAEKAQQSGAVQGASDDEAESALSPFGPQRFDNAAACWTHAEATHGFSLARLRRAFGASVWTDYHRIRLVNYLRSLGPEEACKEAPGLSPSSAIWAEDKWLQPVLEDDRLLFDDDDEENDDEAAEEVAAASMSAGPSASASNAAVSVEILMEENARLRSELASARKLVATLLGDEDAAPGAASSAAARGSGPGRAGGVGSSRADRPAWHGFDPKVCEAFRQALLATPAAIDGKDFADVGCATATLATLAGRLGARSVAAHGPSDAGAEAARRAVAQVGGMADLVHFSPWRVAPPGPVPSPPDCDLLASEQLLTELRYGPPLMRLLAARQQRLRPEGRVLPERVTLHICAVDFSSEISAYEKWAELPLGGLFSPEEPLPETFRQPCLAPPALEPAVDLGVGRVASQGAAQLIAINMAAPEDPLPNRKSFHLKLRQGRCATALAIYLEADLGGQPAARLSAAPPGCEPNDLLRPEPPAWAPWHRPRQTVLHLADDRGRPLRLSGAEFPAVEGHFTATCSADAERLEIKVELRGCREASGACRAGTGRGKGPDPGASASFVLPA